MTRAAQIQTSPPGAKLQFNENVIFLVAAAILLVAAVVWADKPPTMEKTDFSVTYIGARMVYLGMGSNLYNLDEQRRFKAGLLKNAEPLIYEHPPFEAFLLAPLGALRYKTAYLIWGLINVAIWLLLPYLLRPYAPSPQDDLAYCGLWLLFAPLWVALLQGQSSLLLLLLFALSFIQLKRGNDFKAGLILALGLFKFQFIIPFAVIFLLRRKWRFLLGFAITALVLCALSLVAVGWAGIWSYYHLLTSIAAHPENSSFGAAVGMATVQGFAQTVLGKILSSGAVSLIVAAGSIFLVMYTVWRWRQTEDSGNSCTFDLMFAGAIAVSLLVGFHMFTHDLSPLMLALLLASAHLPGRHNALSLILRLTLVLFWIPPFYVALLTWHSVYLWFPVLLVFAGATLKLATETTAKVFGPAHTDHGIASR
jgi:hypothetical protein